MGHISSLVKVVISAQAAVCFPFFQEKLRNSAMPFAAISSGTEVWSED